MAHELIENMFVDLEITGIRRAEGGVRKMVIKSCFDKSDDGPDKYRPLFWFTNADKEYYKEKFGVEHSRCYTEYGFTRTGCACCPFGSKDLYKELQATKEYEPKLYKAVTNVFSESIEYTRQWQQYQFDKKIEYMNNKGK